MASSTEVGSRKHVAVAESGHSDAEPLQVSAPSIVADPASLQRMLTSIQLDCQLLGWAVEVEDVGTHRMLPPKLGASDLARSQEIPQALLGIRPRLTPSDARWRMPLWSP